MRNFDLAMLHEQMRQLSRERLGQIAEHAGAGQDLVRTDQPFALLDNVEDLDLTGGAAVNGDGNSAGNVISGNKANNELRGRGGVDVLQGGRGDDLLVGGEGADSLYGGSGDDKLRGGLDRDALSGGKGRDRFLFSFETEVGRGRDRDVVADFSSRQGDRIDLRDIDADQGLGGDQAFRLIVDGGFSGRAGELRYKGGLLLGDTDGDGRGDFHIELAGAPSLLEADILL